jgi:hypothetical protein
MQDPAEKPPKKWKEYLEQHESISRLIEARQVHYLDASPVADSSPVSLRTFEIAEPIPVWLLSNRDIMEKGVRSGRILSWRSIIFDREQIIGAIDLVKRHNDEPGLRGLMRSAALQQFEEVLKVAAGASKNKQEVRILELPGLSFRALWLVSDSGAGDLFVPFVAKYGLEVQAYAEGPFLKVLQQFAEGEPRKERGGKEKRKVKEGA